MTEETRKAIDRICDGEPIECSAEDYRSGIRDALVRFALACLDINDRGRMQTALAEVNRLDRKHGDWPSTEPPNKGAEAEANRGEAI
ncbi:MAG TPA: hypothetical protein VFV58_18555 [Blastocatellia bacterium]|jgi:hypothetical protein|nr:hypothetical protein [Blastocatellia bacterium]